MGTMQQTQEMTRDSLMAVLSTMKPPRGRADLRRRVMALQTEWWDKREQGRRIEELRRIVAGETTPALHILSKTGRCANGAERDAGHLHHAVYEGMGGVAVCGTEPGRRADWSWHEGERVTCPKCLKVMDTPAGD